MLFPTTGIVLSYVGMDVLGFHAMTQKKIVKHHTKDQVKHTHREAFKGHRTRKHFLTSVKAEEADAEIFNEQKEKRYGE